MDDDGGVVTTQVSNTSTGKKRIPKACGSCRFSKVRCDGGNPCARCNHLNKVCVFAEKPQDPHEHKIETLERELSSLKQRLDLQRVGPSVLTVTSGTQFSSVNGNSTYVPHEATNLPQFSPATISSSGTTTRKRTRSQFEVEGSSVPNFVTKGIITPEQAELFFGAFFQGCDRYVPVFDPQHDTFESISNRSPLLLNAIVTIGCGVLSDADSQLCHLLNFHLKKSINLVIVDAEHTTLEAVQALLVIACYASERSLLLAFATRSALDLGLPDAYEELRRKLVSGTSSYSKDPPTLEESDAVLMRRARVWFQLMVLEQILHVDAGNLRSFRLKGDPRRCRILLSKPFTTTLDLRLLSQVELNALRGKTHDSISKLDQLEEDEVMDILQDVQLDIEVWYNDWKNIMGAAPTSETPVLLVNLEVQKCWSQTVALCRATRALGTDDVTALTQGQRDLLNMAKVALERHLRIILDQPQHYLAKFCYATDFVWAKCAFCFLLLLKLTRLLSDTDSLAKRQLLEDGYRLLKELNKAGGGMASGGRSATSKVYLQVLHQSIEKYGQALDNETQFQSDNDIIDPGQHSTSPYFWTTGGINTIASDFDSYIPTEFITEWDFVGLDITKKAAINNDGFFDEFVFGNALSEAFLYPGASV